MHPIAIRFKRPGERIKDLYMLQCAHLQDGSWKAEYQSISDRATLPLGITGNAVCAATMNEVLEKMQSALISNGYLET